MAGHTLTARRGLSLILVGGYSPENGFNQQLLEYQLASSTWVSGVQSGTPPTGGPGLTSGPRGCCHMVVVGGRDLASGVVVSVFPFEFSGCHVFRISSPSPPVMELLSPHFRPLSTETTVLLPAKFFWPPKFSAYLQCQPGVQCCGVYILRRGAQQSWRYS